jgi:multisubunit Na+/H+ antiporter MnhF subunit
VNGWLLAAGALLLGAFLPALWLAATGSLERRIAGLQLAGSVLVLVLLLLAQEFGQSSYLIVPLVLVVASFPGTLVFTRLLGTDR